MFEKETEEWVIDSVCKDCTRYDKCKSKEHCTCKECSKEKWQDGAMFGYNKANEWHKQEDNDIYDLISEDWSVRYFICIMKDKSRVTAIGNCDEGCNGDVSVNLFFDHDDEKYCLDDIVWWKQIVLPKEMKEND